MEKPISDGSNTYTALKLRHRTPDKSKKGQKSNRRESDEMSTKSPTQRCEDNDKTEVEDHSSDLVKIDDSTVLPTLSEVKIQEKIISPCWWRHLTALLNHQIILLLSQSNCNKPNLR